MKLIPAIRGMRDILPPDTRVWRHIENVAAARFAQFGYGEIRTPLLERAELFSRQLGEHTDIVRKEMYQFNDKGRDGDEDKGDMICLRPESTVSTVRAAAAAGLHRGGLCRLWYGGVMFRRERPQAGRYRQFWQLGAEALSGNSASPSVDAEQIIMLSELWADLGIAGRLQLMLNNLGSAEERAKYREKLRDFFGQYESDLDETAKQQLKGNPLRLLDAKEGRAAELAADAPKMSDSLSAESRQYVDDVCEIISAAGVSFEEAPLLVRGLDYYNLTVFEWVMKDDERRQNTICGGGRYDGLAEQIGAPPLFGCGFALGLDRLVTFVEKHSEKNSSTKTLRGTDCFLAATGASSAYCARAAAMLRAGGFSVWQHTGGGNLAKQIKKASDAAAIFAMIVGEDEEKKGTVSVKHLGGEGQQSAALSDVAKVARNMMEMHEQSANANQNKNKKHTTRSAQQ